MFIVLVHVFFSYTVTLLLKAWNVKIKICITINKVDFFFIKLSFRLMKIIITVTLNDGMKINNDLY